MDDEIVEEMNELLSMIGNGIVAAHNDRFIFLPFHHVGQIENTVIIMTAALRSFGVDISQCEWSVSDDYLDFGYYEMMVRYSVRR